MKRIAVSILAIMTTTILLTGCFGGDAEETPTTPEEVSTVFSKYEAVDFSINYPKDWEILDKNDFTSTIPSQTVVVFRNNIKNNIFTTNLSINQAEIAQGTSSQDFALQILNTEKYNLIGFTEIDREEFTVGEEKAFIVTFQGKKTVTENTVQFEQLCIARNGYGIIITAGYLPNEDQSLVQKLDEMVRSFSLK